MALDKEKMAKVIQSIQTKGVTPQGPGADLKNKMKRRKKSKKDELPFKDEDFARPSQTSGASY